MSIYFFHFYPPVLVPGWSLRHILDKVTQWHFYITSKEVSWTPQIIKFQVPFLQFFRMGWDGCALLVWPSRIPHWNSKILFVLGAI